MNRPAYVDLTLDGQIIRVRCPPDKTLGADMRLAGAAAAVWMFQQREWWLPIQQWMKVVDLLNSRYDVKMTELARAALTELNIDDKLADQDNLYLAATQLGLRILAPEHVVHAAWLSYLAQGFDRDYLKSAADAYLQICKARGLQPDMTAIRI